MAVDFKLIGNRIKEFRKASGKPQQDLAADIYVSAGNIIQIELGLTKFNLKTLPKLPTY